MKFDDFKAVEGDLTDNLKKTLSGLIKKFLAQNGITKVDALRLNLKTQPFKDLCIGFLVGKTAFLFDRNQLKAPNLQEKLDSILAVVFSEFDEKELKKLCFSLEKHLVLTFVKKRNLKNV